MTRQREPQQYLGMLSECTGEVRATPQAPSHKLGELFLCHGLSWRSVE